MKINLKDRGYLQISFAWLFAIIAGIIILALAFYMVGKINNTGSKISPTVTGKQIGILMDPLETGFESSVTTLTIPTETQIWNQCNNLSGSFGTQGIRLAQQSQGKWAFADFPSTFENKYIFSEDDVQGQNFFVFSKSLDFPYKVADLIYLTSSETNYCFMNPPKNITDELTQLNESNIFLSKCPSGSIKVCFDSSLSGCDINVNTNDYSVSSKEGTVYYYNNALMYAAIFSSPQVYECQSSRLIQRAKQLAQLYQSKSSLLASEGCQTNINILGYKASLEGYTSSFDWATLSSDENQLNTQNRASECQLW